MRSTHQAEGVIEKIEFKDLAGLSSEPQVLEPAAVFNQYG